jgi:hypothetical protein
VTAGLDAPVSTLPRSATSRTHVLLDGRSLHAEFADDRADRDASIRQTELFARRYGEFGRCGLSAFLARDDDDVRDLGADQLERFETLLILAVADVVAGFDVVATFRMPHVTIAFSDAPADAIARLLG